MAQHKANKPSHAFAGLVSFLRAPICNDLDQINADIAVMGAPTDEGSPFMPGSRLGSRSIREHSLRFGDEGYFDHDSNKEYPVSYKHLRANETLRYLLCSVVL
mgnify:CR=1 FL=1